MNLRDYLDNPEQPAILSLKLLPALLPLLGEETGIECVRVRDSGFEVLENYREASEASEASESVHETLQESPCPEGWRLVHQVFLNGKLAGYVEIVSSANQAFLSITRRILRHVIQHRVQMFESREAHEHLHTRLRQSQRQLERVGGRFEEVSTDNLTRHHDLAEANQRLSQLIEEKTRLLDDALQRTRMFQILENADFSRQETFLEQCTQLLSSALKADRTIIFSGRGLNLNTIYIQGSGHVDSFQFSGSNIILRAMETGRPVRLPSSLWSESGLNRTLMSALQAGPTQTYACMAIPVERHGEKLGAVLILRKEPSFQREDELRARQMAGFLRSHLAIYELIAAEVESRREMDGLLSTIPDVIYRLDPKGRFRYISPSVSRFGWRPEDLSGQHFSVLIQDHKRSFENMHPPRQSRAQSRSETKPFEVGIRPGPLAPSRHQPLIGEVLASGHIHQSGGIIRDVSLRHLAQKDLAATQKEKNRLEDQLLQLQKMEIIGSLAGGIAHDFNNLLQPILGYSILSLEHLDAETQEYKWIEQVHTAARRARELVRQILALSRKTTSEHRSVNLIELAQEVLQLMRATAPRHVEMELDFEDKVLLTYGDPAQLHQVLMNLCTNACQAMLEKGGKLRLEVRHQPPTRQQLQAHILIRVQDDGYGMTPSVQEKIFEPFFTTKTKDRGTGLGLSVVKGIVESHQGTIDVVSKAGEGTEFTLFLPELDESKVETRSKPTQIPKGSGEAVLLVDDEEIILELGREVLDRQGYEVHTASSGKEALDLVRHGLQPDLLVTDHFMPAQLGSDLIREVRTLKPNLPALMTTGNDVHEGEQLLHDLPGSRCLMKPLDPDELCLAVHQLLHAQTSFSEDDTARSEQAPRPQPE